MKKYQSKPVVVEAMQLNKDNANQIREWASKYDAHTQIIYKNYEVVYINIKTPQRNMKVELGDWIVKGINNEFHFCNNDFFQESYEVSI